MSAKRRTNYDGKTTPRLFKPSTVARKLNSTSAINSTISEPVIVDPTHSQRYMQHKLDMAYNKYIQNLALESILTKMHKDAERSYDEQLAHYQEKYETAVEELQAKREYVSDIETAMENDSKLNFLESALDDIYNVINENEIIKKMDKINNNLQSICDNLNFKNTTFESSDENYTKLQNILKEISKLLVEINEENDENFNLFVENILESKELITKLKKNQEDVTISQSKLNKIVLKTASLELSKRDENEQIIQANITPI